MFFLVPLFTCVSPSLTFPIFFFVPLQLKTNIPEDLVPILAKDADKQKAIIEKAHADALIASTRTSPLVSKAAAVPSPVTLNTSFANRRQLVGNAGAAPSAAAAALAARGGGKIAMNIQDIPPFNPAAKTSKPPATLGVGPAGSSSVPPGPPSPAFSSASQASAAKLNINAPAFVFKPNPNASAFRPVGLLFPLIVLRSTRY